MLNFGICLGKNEFIKTYKVFIYILLIVKIIITMPFTVMELAIYTGFIIQLGVQIQANAYSHFHNSSRLIQHTKGKQVTSICRFVYQHG